MQVPSMSKSLKCEVSVLKGGSLHLFLKTQTLLSQNIRRVFTMQIHLISKLRFA